MHLFPDVCAPARFIQSCLPPNRPSCLLVRPLLFPSHYTTLRRSRQYAARIKALSETDTTSSAAFAELTLHSGSCAAVICFAARIKGLFVRGLGRGFSQKSRLPSGLPNVFPYGSTRS